MNHMESRRMLSNFRAWNLPTFVIESHYQVMVYFTGSLVFRLLNPSFAGALLLSQRLYWSNLLHQ